MTRASRANDKGAAAAEEVAHRACDEDRALRKGDPLPIAARPSTQCQRRNRMREDARIAGIAHRRDRTPVQARHTRVPRGVVIARALAAITQAPRAVVLAAAGEFDSTAER